MKPYAKEYTLTESTIQDSRDLANLELFGLANDNVKYAHSWNQVKGLGHKVEMVFNDCRNTLQMVSTVVLYKENMRLKKAHLPALGKELQKKYLNKWKADNEVWLNTVFGLADSLQLQFLTGILFATSSSKQMVLLLQQAVQADGAYS